MYIYLVEVDDGLPELVLELVEVPHTDLTEVTRVVLVHVGTVVVLTTGKTTTTGRLAVLSNTTVTGGDMAATVNVLLVILSSNIVVCCLVRRSLTRARKVAVWKWRYESKRTACGSW